MEGQFSLLNTVNDSSNGLFPTQLIPFILLGYNNNGFEELEVKASS